MANLIPEEVMLVIKINKFLVQNQFSLLFNENEIIESIAEAKVLSDLYVDLHIQLKTELGDAYTEAYPAYDDYVN